MPTKLFVGNINHTATENDLQDHFAAAGTVVSVNIIQDRMTGRSRGFGLVEMSSAEEAEKAVSLFHEKDFQGRALTVNEARPREERSGGGGGGGGGRRSFGGGGGGGGGGRGGFGGGRGGWRRRPWRSRWRPWRLPEALLSRLRPRRRSDNRISQTPRFRPGRFA